MSGKKTTAKAPLDPADWDFSNVPAAELPASFLWEYARESAWILDLAEAEGFIGDDEKTWTARPLYARRAMTQTRAMSRAARSAFAYASGCRFPWSADSKRIAGNLPERNPRRHPGTGHMEPEKRGVRRDCFRERDPASSKTIRRFFFSGGVPSSSSSALSGSASPSRNWRKHFRDFQELVRRAEAEAVKLNLAVIQAAAASGKSWQAAAREWVATAP